MQPARRNIDSHGQPADPSRERTDDVPGEEAARAHVRAVVAASHTSFLAGMRLLPPPRREAMYAVYAFCREVDDIADEPGALDDKRRALEAWRREIKALYAGHPHFPTAVALAGPVERYGLAKADFLAVIEGMEMDAAEAMRAPPMVELTRYCDRVAAAVGRLSVKAFGATEPEAEQVAQHLGQALQLTNILRDLDEDAARGRLYLPAELLDKHGIAARDPAAVLAHPKLGAVCEEIADLAEAHYAKARAALAHCDRKPMKPAIVMMEVYHRILHALRRRGWARHAEPVRVGKLAKLAIAIRHGIL
jgi:squalene synthase HpnD